MPRGTSRDKGRQERGGRSHAGAAEGEGRAAPSAIWSGTITFGLVSVPVDLFAGMRRPYQGLRMITADGARLRRQYYCPEEDRPVPPEEIVRGAEVEKDEFVIITDEELEGLAPERSREIDLRRFVSRDAIPPIYYNRPYILAPASESTKAYRLLAAAMEKQGRAGIATFVMRGKEYLVAILAEDGILRAETLRFPGELRPADEVPLPDRPDVPKKQVQRLVRAIDGLTASALQTDELHDQQARALEQLVRRKREQGEDVVQPAGEEPPEEESAEVVDIMQVLKRRMVASGGGSARAAASGGGRDGSRRERPSGERGDGRKGGRKGERERDRQPLRAKTKDELYRQAQELGVEGRSNMSKDELIEAIQAST